MAQEPIDNILYAAAIGIKNAYNNAMNEETKCAVLGENTQKCEMYPNCENCQNRVLSDEELIFTDVCGRLFYGVKAIVPGWDEENQEEVNIPLKIYSINTDGYLRFENNDYGVDYYGVEHCTLLLRPMWSLTKEEIEELDGIPISRYASYGDFAMVANHKQIEWLNKHMIDFRGLIDRGLAVEAPEGTYNFGTDDERE